MWRSRAARNFIILHLAGLVGLLLFPLYTALARKLTAVLPGCILHDLLFIYCPLCGGTRAVEALLRLDLPAALAANGFVVLCVGIALVCYVRAWVRLLRGKERLWTLPGAFWIVMTVLMLAFWILRNVLMIGFGIDPTGDLAWLWNRI